MSRGDGPSPFLDRLVHSPLHPNPRPPSTGVLVKTSRQLGTRSATSMSASCCMGKAANTREIAATIMTESHPDARPPTTAAVSSSRGMGCHASTLQQLLQHFSHPLLSPSNTRAGPRDMLGESCLFPPHHAARRNQPHSSVPLGLLEPRSVPVRGSCDDRHWSFSR